MNSRFLIDFKIVNVNAWNVDYFEHETLYFMKKQYLKREIFHII